MNKLKVSSIALIAAFVFFAVYNSYFGWNIDAQSKSEVICDNIYKFLINGALFLYFMPIVQYCSRKVVELEKNRGGWEAVAEATAEEARRRAKDEQLVKEWEGTEAKGDA